MKRILSFVLFVLVAAGTMASDVDLVVVMDTSESMFPYFEDLRSYLIEDLLQEKLHRGDTFHLLSFSGSPELETAVTLADERAAEKAFGRLALLHPLGRYTDLIAALRFVHQYVRQLPEGNAKTVLLLTDGIHDPPPGSPNRLPPEEVRAAVRAAAEAIRREGWTVQALKVPAELTAADKANGLPSYLDEIAAGLGIAVIPYDPARKAEVTGILTGYPTLTFPEPLGEVGRRFTVPLRVRNFSKDPILVRLTGAQIDHVEVLERPVEVAVPANATGRSRRACACRSPSRPAPRSACWPSIFPPPSGSRLSRVPFHSRTRDGAASTCPGSTPCTWSTSSSRPAPCTPSCACSC